MSATPTIPSTAQWFALHTLSGQENKVKAYIEKFKKAEELEDYIFEVLLPTEVVSEVKNGKKTTKVRKLYPGYVFIQMWLYGEDKKVIKTKSKKKTAKKTKTKRITKAERLRIEGEKDCPKRVIVCNDSNSFGSEVEVTPWWWEGTNSRRVDIRADIINWSVPAAPVVTFDDPVYVRRIAAALNAAADWMEGGK
jgi:hypothetical protein